MTLAPNLKYPPITKAIIPAAGLGTRFLPATKAMPKEMLTVVNKPIIQYAVEEAYAAGIREFIIITGRGKAAMENHFDHPYELADTLAKKGKLAELDLVTNIVPADARFYYTRQGEPLGLGHAVWCGHAITANEPFVVILPDDVLCRAQGNDLAEMIALHQHTGQSIVLAEDVAPERTVNYGICDPAGPAQNGAIPVKGFIEKPKPADAPSTLGVVGRYILTPRHMQLLANAKPGKGGEIQLTDAMAIVAAEEGFIAKKMVGQRFDCGDKVGFQMANLHFALQDPEIAPRLKPFVQHMAKA
jgi:UTP--glucose-1-phosphate uridylyltransferase